MAKIYDKKNFLDIQVGTYEVSFNKKYRFIALLNDFTLGLWFLIGSVLFLYESTQTTGTILFIVGSAQLLARPIIKIMHAFYFTRVNKYEASSD
ncbi:YrhK family protein [Virgibacillus ndiopensis]|uniref:YrhK family protein n=1 Tax=Virgibacillus ndiopensis TaxID=2004408 RepID=UPI000C070FF8|nr:YrhK family protein [Virgibacillus ndiopensis]